jgi:hypothetical protein
MGKFIVGTIGMIVITIVAFIGLRVFFCGLDQSDVRVMKSMAEKISQHIVKHGIPKSLKDIPGLPYELEGCEEKIDYTNKRKPVNTIEKASTGNIYQKCIFKNDYTISLHFTFFYKEKDCIGSLKIVNKYSETVGITSYSCKNQSIIEKETIFGSSKISGVCSPMKQ